MNIISYGEAENLNLSNDLQIELSLISTGLIITDIEGKVIFLLKDSQNMINGLKELKSAAISIDPIERPEFPAVNLLLKLKTDKDLSVKYDYFFNFESDYDMNLLNNIGYQKKVDLYLFTEKAENYVKLELEEEESESIKKSVNEFKI